MRKIYVEDFGAKADGITDNTKAVNAAIEYAISLNEPVEICFKANATYFFDGISTEPSQSVFVIKKSENLSLVGENTTILTDKARPYVLAHRNANLRISGFNFDQKTRAHFVGSFLEVNKEELSACFKIDRDIEFDEDYQPIQFALQDTGYKLSRIFYYLKKYEWVDKENRILKVYFGPDALGTHGNVRNRLKDGVSLIFPTPNVGHFGKRSFTFRGNRDTVFENCRVWNAPFFVFGVWWEYGTMIFKNVSVAPPLEEIAEFVAWRDCYHCKSNPGKIIWDGCTVKGCHDDIINLSANMMYLEKVNSPTDIECYWRETRGGYYAEKHGAVLPGDDIVIWNVDTGELVARTKVVKAIGDNINRYILEDPISDLATGPQVRVCIESHIANGSQILNCDFKGTLRIKHNITVRNTKLYLIKMWIENHEHLEGPLPRNILFENSKFYTNTPNEPVYYITSNNMVKPMKDDKAYCIENIVFKNCEGLSKGNFFYKENFVSGSVNEVTIIND